MTSSAAETVDKRNVIPIVFGFDVNYIRPAAVAIVSLLIRANDSTFYKIYILTDEFFDESIKVKFDKILSTFHNCSLNWVCVDSKTFSDAPTAWNASKATYYRLIIPRVIDESKVLWSDVDVQFTGDMASIFNIGMEGYYWAGVIAEYTLKSRAHAYFPENKNEFIYMPGFMVMNLEKMRTDAMVDVFFNNIRKFSSQLKMFDLDILNISCDKIKPIPFSYCVLENLWNNKDIRSAHEYTWLRNYYSHSQLLEAKRNPAIVHYAGAYPKIWNRDYSTISDDYLAYLVNVDRILCISKKNPFKFSKAKIKIVLKNILKRVYTSTIKKAAVFASSLLEKCFARIEAIFLKKNIRANSVGKSVVLIEPNKTHYELLPSFSKFFSDIGYTVHMIVRNGFSAEYKREVITSDNVFVYECAYESMHVLLDRLDETIDFYILTTSVVYARCTYDFLSLHDNDIKTKFGGFALLHDMNDINSKQTRDLYFRGRLLTIGNKDARCSAIHPVVFTENPKRTKKTIVRFIVVGAFEIGRRDYSMLEDAARFLLRSNIINFDILLVGNQYKYVVPDDLKSHVHLHGRVDFLTLSSLMSNSDFILPLLNKNIKGHLRYKKRVSSGTKQLMYAYEIPCVIDKFFLNAFEITEDMAVTYTQQNLEHGLICAINMSTSDYQSIVTTLAYNRGRLYKESLNNIQKIISDASGTRIAGDK